MIDCIMNRKHFLKIAQIVCPGFYFAPTIASNSFLEKELNEVKRINLKVKDFNQPDLPVGTRTPFGWPVFGISPGQAIFLKPEAKLMGTYHWLRISVALEMFEVNRLHVHITNTNVYLGAIDIRFSSVLVPYEIQIENKYVEQINQNGIELTLEGQSPFWFFSEPASGFDNSAFLPCFIDSALKTGDTNDFLDCFLSANSVQSFAWREGCVLDGLWQVYEQKNDERALETIHQHFDLFFVGQDLIYENARSVPIDNEIGGIESTLPFAVLAKVDPDHPILEKVVEALNQRKKENGMITDGNMISSEGCYTVAYPMAVIGKAWGRKDLIETAIDQLRHRILLMHNNQFYLRYEEGERSFQNWARGVAWFLLGFARTISELKDDSVDEDIIQKFREGVDLALSFQDSSGLWSCFLHKKEILPDTSGSAGIAAAILTGVREGFLPEEYKKPALKCWDSLQDYLTPDGYLKGAAQDNRGGIELQESDYRVIAQMAMGLMAQLYAEIN